MFVKVLGEGEKGKKRRKSRNICQREGVAQEVHPGEQFSCLVQQIKQDHGKKKLEQRGMKSSNTHPGYWSLESFCDC
jgi:hypothetical protein